MKKSGDPMTTREKVLAVVLLTVTGALAAIALDGGWFAHDAAVGAGVGAAIGLLATQFSPTSARNR